MLALVCVHPFQHHVTGKSYDRGDKITDASEIGFLSSDKDHHFVRINDPDPPPEPVHETVVHDEPIEHAADVHD
jgi:hypothetical protein